MKYTILQVGEEIKAGDEIYLLKKRSWERRIDSNYGVVLEADMENGYFYRRPVRRTEIEVKEGTDKELGCVVLLDEELEEFYLSNEEGDFSLPVSYAQKLIDAIKEVAGL